MTRATGAEPVFIKARYRATSKTDRRLPSDAAAKKTGTRRADHAELDPMLQFLHLGDTLVITRIDRRARSLKDLQDDVPERKGTGVTPNSRWTPRSQLARLSSTCSGPCRVRAQSARQEATNLMSQIALHIRTEGLSQGDRRTNRKRAGQFRVSRSPIRAQQ